MDRKELHRIDSGQLTAEEQAMLEGIDKAEEKYSGHEGALIMVLHEAQEIYGYLPEDLQFYIAGKMGIPIAEVSGVVFFHNKKERQAYDPSMPGNCLLCKRRQASRRSYKGRT